MAKKMTNDEIERLPITNKSLKMQSHKRELEEKMARLEKAIYTFSKPKVYVQIWYVLLDVLIWLFQHKNYQIF